MNVPLICTIPRPRKSKNDHLKAEESPIFFDEIDMGVSKNRGKPPKSSILIGFSIVNHPFWGTPIFGNTHMYTLKKSGNSVQKKSWDFQGSGENHSYGHLRRFEKCLNVYRKADVPWIWLCKQTSSVKGQLGVPLTYMYPWYLLCSLGILGDYNP